MSGMPLSTIERQTILTLYSAGVKVSKIAPKVHRSQSQVKSIIQHYRRTDLVQHMKNPGRKRSTTAGTDRKIIKSALENWRMKLDDLRLKVQHELKVPISAKTIMRRLHATMLYRRAGRKTPLLTPRHQAARLAWCRDKAKWTSAQLKKVIWFDKSKFCLVGSRGCLGVWRCSREALLSHCCNPTVKHGGGKLLYKSNVRDGQLQKWNSL